MRRISLYREHSYTRQMETEGLLMRLKQNSSSPEMPWSPAQKQRKSLKPLLWPLFRDRNDLGWTSHILPTPPERRQHEYTVRLSSLMRGGRKGRKGSTLQVGIWENKNKEPKPLSWHKSKIKKPRTVIKGEKSSHGISAFWKILRNHYKPMLWKINWKTVFLNSLKGYVLCSLLLSSIFRLKLQNTISYMKFYKHLCFLDSFISSTRIYWVLLLCQVLATELLILQSAWLQELIVLGKEPTNRMGWGSTGPNGVCPVDEVTRHGHCEDGGTRTGDLNKVRKTLGGRASAKVSRWAWHVEGGGQGGGGAEAARRLMQLQQKEWVWEHRKHRERPRQRPARSERASQATSKSQSKSLPVGATKGVPWWDAGSCSWPQKRLWVLEGEGVKQEGRRGAFPALIMTKRSFYTHKLNYSIRRNNFRQKAFHGI